MATLQVLESLDPLPQESLDPVPQGSLDPAPQGSLDPAPRQSYLEDLLARAARCQAHHGVHPLLVGATMFQAMYKEPRHARQPYPPGFAACLNLQGHASAPGPSVPVGTAGPAHGGAPVEDPSDHAEPGESDVESPTAGTALPRYYGLCVGWLARFGFVV